MTETTLRADLGTVDSIDSCKPKTDRELNLSDNISDDISDFTDPTVNLTDRTELIDVRKRLMSDSEDLQYTTFPQLEASAPLASSTGSAATPLSTSSAAMLTMFYILIPPPSTLRSLMFERANVIEFLERYKDLYFNYKVFEEDKLIRLLQYCIQPVAETIKSLKE